MSKMHVIFIFLYLLKFISFFIQKVKEKIRKWKKIQLENITKTVEKHFWLC